MKIKKLTASFGTLKNETLELAPGLNIIRAPNERGKSSWAAFIRTMFFGIDTAARKKGGVLPDKTRFLPWSGTAMEGAAEISCRLGDITIERASRGNSPMEKLTAVFTGTAATVPEITSENAGETLLGVSEPVFTRSAFISQLGIRVENVAELEKKISSLISTGDEEVSYSAADTALRAWQRKIRYNKIGELPETEAKIKEIDEKLALLENAAERSAQQRLRIEEFLREKETLGAELEAHEAYAQAKKTGRLKTAKARLDSEKSRLSEAETKLEGLSPLPTMPEIASLKGEISALSALDEVRQKAAAAKDLSDDVLLQAQKKRESSPASKAGGEDLIQRLSTLEAEAGGRRGSAGIVLIVCAIALGIISVFAAGALRYALIAVAALTAIIGVLNVAGIITIVPRSKKMREFAQLLSEYGVSSADELRTRIGEYSALTAELNRAESEAGAAKNALINADTSYDAAVMSLLPKLKRLKLEEAGHSELITRLSEIEKNADEYWRLKGDCEAAQKVYSALAESIENGAPESDVPAERPESDRDEIQARYNRLNSALDAANNEYNIYLGEMRGIGDPLVLGSEKMALEAKLSVLKTEYESISIAIDALEKANTEMQTRFAPILNKTAGEYISRLTGAKYESLMFDKAMSAVAKAAGDAVSRELGYLSAGTADQIYLALRLAIVDLCLPEEDMCPIVLDDALVNFDDRRCEAALDLFIELAEKRQIIAFTCHGREANYCRNHADVKIIDLY